MYENIVIHILLVWFYVYLNFYLISFIYFDDYDMPGAKEGNCQKAVTGKNTAEDSLLRNE